MLLRIRRSLTRPPGHGNLARAPEPSSIDVALATSPVGDGPDGQILWKRYEGVSFPLSFSYAHQVRSCRDFRIGADMQDMIWIALMLGLTAVTLAYVRLCGNA